MAELGEDLGGAIGPQVGIFVEIAQLRGEDLRYRAHHRDQGQALQPAAAGLDPRDRDALLVLRWIDAKSELREQLDVAEAGSLRRSPQLEILAVVGGQRPRNQASPPPAADDAVAIGD